MQMLTLDGGASEESPVMGAMSDLDPNNAYTIMSYMSIKVRSCTSAYSIQIECCMYISALRQLWHRRTLCQRLQALAS